MSFPVDRPLFPAKDFQQMKSEVVVEPDSSYDVKFAAAKKWLSWIRAHGCGLNSLAWVNVLATYPFLFAHLSEMSLEIEIGSGKSYNAALRWWADSAVELTDLDTIHDAQNVGTSWCNAKSKFNSDEYATVRDLSRACATMQCLVDNSQGVGEHTRRLAILHIGNMKKAVETVIDGFKNLTDIFGEILEPRINRLMTDSDYRRVIEAKVRKDLGEREFFSHSYEYYVRPYDRERWGDSL